MFSKTLPIISFLSGSLGYFIHDYLQKQKKEVEPEIIIKPRPFLEEFDEKYGLPSKENLMEFKAYTSSLNFERKIPNWSLQILSKEDMKPKEGDDVDRKYSNFSNNIPNVPIQFRAKNEDYFHSGWSRGHMCPASDAKHLTQEAMNETFLLNANIVPQNLNNNQDYWYRFETFVRRNVLNYFDKAIIVSGPIFLPIEENNKKYIKYQVIGENEVAVPTHLFKVILGEKDGEKYLDAFVVPNAPIKDKPILDFRKDVSFIEKHTGLIFFDKVKPNRYVCDQMECQLMTNEEYQEKIKIWNNNKPAPNEKKVTQ